MVPKPGGGESRRYVYGKSPEEVEDELVELRKQVRSGTPVTPAGLKLGQYLSEWMEQVAAPGYGRARRGRTGMQSLNI